MHIKHLEFSNVGPFREASFDLDRQVNVFTGPNNSGKSTVLWVLGDVLVYPFLFPIKLLRGGESAAFSMHTSDGGSLGGNLPMVVPILDGSEADDTSWTLETRERYLQFLADIGYTKFIPAMRRPTDFRSPGPTSGQDDLEDDQTLPTRREGEPISRAVMARRNWATRKRLLEGQPELQRRISLVSRDPSLVSDEEVIQRIIDLDYRSYLRRNPALRQTVDKIARMATDIAEGFPITFNGVDEDPTGFYPSFETIDGIVPLNTMSQGTQSIIQWLAHLVIGYAEYYDFPERLEDEPGILIVDEIDAHLHPAWQRGIIPTLTKHFPNLQIFCSTHSPLMLAGLDPGQVQLLTRDENGGVQVSRNEFSIAGWSADQILRNLLGVRNPTDLKTIENIDKLEALSTKEQLNQEESAELDRLNSLVERQGTGGSSSILIEKLIHGIKEYQEGASPPEPESIS